MTTDLRPCDDPVPKIRLLGGFDVVSADRSVLLPKNAQRVLGFLAVTGHQQRREAVATHLWPVASADRALSNLRTAIWRVRQVLPTILHSGRETVRLCDDVEIDYQVLTHQARRHLAEPDRDECLLNLAPDLFEADLLPGWDEDWLLLDRERHRQMRIHLLENLSVALRGRGQLARAIDVARAAIRIEPLHESAHAALIGAHLAEGNRVEAIRDFRVYCVLLQDEAGLRPSVEMVRLLDGLQPTELAQPSAPAPAREPAGHSATPAPSQPK